MNLKDLYLKGKLTTSFEQSCIVFEKNYIINKCPTIKHIHCDPKHKVTVVVFMDDSKEICRCAEGDEYNEYAGICICIAKHLYGKSKLEKLFDSNKKTIYNKNMKNKKGAK